MVNRAAVLLYGKSPLVKWINESDPDNDEPNVSAEDVNEDKTVYLIDENEVENLDEWIALNHDVLFETELESWHTDESLWPQNRNLELFQQWFDVQCHSLILDAGTGPISDEE